MAERNPANKSTRRSAKSTTGGESRGALVTKAAG